MVCGAKWIPPFSQKQAQELYNALKKAYSLRSAIAHGSTTKKISDWKQEIKELEDLFADAIKKILRDEVFFNRFNSSKMNKDFLDDLVFQIPRQ